VLPVCGVRLRIGVRLTRHVPRGRLCRAQRLNRARVPKSRGPRFITSRQIDANLTQTVIQYRLQ
jgi:hypothetical protein